MFHRIKALLHRQPKPEAQPLHIDGIKTPLTPRPDKAEEAATALLDMLTGNIADEPQGNLEERYGHNTAEYYHALARRIQSTQERERRGARRILAYVEAGLSNPTPKDTLAAELEKELFSIQAIVEREQGEMFDRWQHCLARVTVVQMEQGEKLSVEVDENELSAEQGNMPGGEG